MIFFTEAELKILQFVWKHERLQIAKVILRKENRPGGACPQLQTILQSYSKQDSMVLTQKQKYKPMEQIESPEINPHLSCYLIFDKRGKNIQWGKDSLFNK